MLATPKFFDSAAKARIAAREALTQSRVACSVSDIFTRVDPEEGKWFGVIVLNTDYLPTLLHARRQLPEFRVIGELFGDPDEKVPEHGDHGRMSHLGSSERARCS